MAADTVRFENADGTFVNSPTVEKESNLLKGHNYILTLLSNAHTQTETHDLQTEAESSHVMLEHFNGFSVGNS